MQLDDALCQVQALKQSLQRTERFCCYRAETIALSGGIALLGSAAQYRWLTNPIAEPAAYLQLWIVVAMMSVAMIAYEMLGRWLRTDSAFRRQQTTIAVTQFAPCLIAGVLVTFAIHIHAPEHFEMLPGLWSVLFSLGIFGSLRQMLPGVVYAAVYYLLSGSCCMMLFRDEWALSPLSMVLTFGVGQLLTAYCMRDSQESNDGT